MGEIKETVFLLIITLFFTVGAFLLTYSAYDGDCIDDQCVDFIPLYIKNPTLAYIGLGLNVIGLILSIFFRWTYKRRSIFLAVIPLVYTAWAAVVVIFKKYSSKYLSLGVPGAVLVIFEGVLCAVFLRRLYELRQKKQ